MWELLLFNLFWIDWVLFAIFASFLVYGVANESHSRAGFGIVAIAITLQCATTIKPFTAILDHPLWAVVYLFAYLGMGLVWVRLKWQSFVYVARDAVREAVREFEVRNPPLDREVFQASSPERVDLEFETKVAGWQFDRSHVMEAALRMTTGYSHTPKIFEHKGRFIMWASYWPLSIAWTLINDPLRRFYDWAYTRMAASLQAVSDRAFSGIGM